MSLNQVDSNNCHVCLIREVLQSHVIIIISVMSSLQSALNSGTAQMVQHGSQGHILCQESPISHSESYIRTSAVRMYMYDEETPKEFLLI